MSTGFTVDHTNVRYYDQRLKLIRSLRATYCINLQQAANIVRLSRVTRASAKLAAGLYFDLDSLRQLFTKAGIKTKEIPARVSRSKAKPKVKPKSDENIESSFCHSLKQNLISLIMQAVDEQKFDRAIELLEIAKKL